MRIYSWRMSFTSPMVNNGKEHSAAATTQATPENELRINVLL